MQTIKLVPDRFNKSIYIAGKKNCYNGVIVLEHLVTEYYMNVESTTAVSIDERLLNNLIYSTIKFTLTVYSTGNNVLNLSGFNVEQIQVLNGESTFTIMKGVGDAYWNIQMKSSDTRPEMWLRCYEKPYVPQFNTGVCSFSNIKLASNNRQFGILSETAPGQNASNNTYYGSFFKINSGNVYAKFPMPVWLKSVTVISTTDTNVTLDKFPIGLQLYGSNDGESWTQILNTSLSVAYGAKDIYQCNTTNYYTFFKFIFMFDINNSQTVTVLPAISLIGFCSELIGTGTYSLATPYSTVLPLNGYNIETNASAMSSTSGNIYSLTQFNTSNIYTMTRSDANTPWEYIFTFPEAIRTIGFSYQERYAYCFDLFTLSYSDDKETWTEYCKVSGTLDAWNEGFNEYQFASYYYDSMSEHRYYKITVYSNSNGNNVQQLAGLSFIQFQKGHYFSFESFVPKLNSNSQSGYMLIPSSSTQGDAYKMFDQSLTTYGGGDITDGEWSLLISLPQATVVRGLEMIAPPSDWNRMPYAFSVQGSDDNDTWTNIKTFLLGSNYWSSANQLGQWDVENETAYSYYRLVVTNTAQGSYVRIGELGLSSYASFKGINWYEDEYLVPVMSSNSQDGYVASANSSQGSYLPFKAFNRQSVKGSTWISNNIQTGEGVIDAWLQVKLPAAQVCNIIQIACGYSDAIYIKSGPKDFEFKGSNDGESWTTLLTVTDQTYNSNNLNTHSFDNDNAYLYYRLHISKIEGASNESRAGVSILNLINRTYHDTLEGE